MKYFLFVGNRLGFEVLSVIAGLVDIRCVVIEKEHEHEYEKFWDKIEGLCIDRHIEYTMNLDTDNITDVLQKVNPDYIMSFGYRRMITSSMRKYAKVLCLGSHFSPLPRYRGFAPLNWLLINGERETAVNLFVLEENVDTGDILFSKKIDIYDEDDINTLFEKCLEEFKKLLVDNIFRLENKSYGRIAQNEEEASYTCSRSPEDGLINWSDCCDNILNLIRALTYPYPCAFTYYKGRKIEIIDAEKYIIPNYVGKIYGKVIQCIQNDGIVVLCKDGAIKIKNVRLDGKITRSSDVIKSVRVTLGK